MPDTSKRKAGGQATKLDEDSESEVEEDVDTEAHGEDEDQLSEQSVSAMSEEDAPSATDSHRKSFFSVRRKRKPSIGSEAHLG